MLRIGHLTFDFPVIQAALAGYSDGPMRMIARQFGAPYALHYVLLDRSIALSPKARRRLLGELDPDDHPVGGQLMGAEPSEFAAAAALMADAGYDVVDVNFGCPVKKVLGRCRGGYLLSDPATACEILKAVRDAVPAAIPVTLKMRRGMDDTPESERNFFRIFDYACELGVAAITVHGRTVRQRYMGRSSAAFIAQVKRHAPTQTVIGSGDLFTADDIACMLECTGVDGVSVARGCIGNPWIFRDARARLAGEALPEPPTVAEQGRVIRMHYARACGTYDAETAARIVRKAGIRYADMHPKPKLVRQAFIAATNPAAFLAALDTWYDPAQDWPPGVRRHRPAELGTIDADLD